MKLSTNSKPLSLALACAGLPAFTGAAASAQTLQIDFGDDRSDYASDGDCDDLRFTGRGMDEILLTDDIGRDATDCRKLFKQGRIQINPLFAEPADSGAIDYGDNDSDYANDGECDDIRFKASNAAEMLYLAEDIGHDANDCRAAVEAGDAFWQGAVAEPEQMRILD